MTIALDVLIGLVAALHLYFLVLEMFLWTRPFGLRTFGQSKEQAEASAALAKNQGLYNGFLAAGLIASLVLPPPSSTALMLFSLICVLVAGLYGAATASRRILFVQALPAAIALVVFALAPRESKEAELIATDTAFSARSVEKGPKEAFLSVFADDALMFSEGGGMISGIAGIREKLAAQKPYQLRWKPLGARAASSGDLGYTWGTYRFDGTSSDGKPATSHGTYLSVWRLEGGRWKLAADIGNEGPPTSD
jgi:putative membrane protein